MNIIKKHMNYYSDSKLYLIPYSLFYFII